MSDAVRLPRVIGHRGAPRDAPENSLAGFARAASLGVTWVELDVQLSRDLVPVVFHDDHLERTSNGRGRLIEQDFAHLRQLDVGSWFSPSFGGEKLPGFDAVLDQLVALGLGVNIEIKAADERAAITAEKGLALALAKWPADRPPPLVTSFSRVALASSRKIAPDWPRGLVADCWPADWREVSERYGCATLHVRADDITAPRVAAAKEAGLIVLAYVVDDPDRARTLWDCGVAALFSDQPQRLLA